MVAVQMHAVGVGTVRRSELNWRWLWCAAHKGVLCWQWVPDVASADFSALRPACVGQRVLCACRRLVVHAQRPVSATAAAPTRRMTPSSCAPPSHASAAATGEALTDGAGACAGCCWNM
jgi:hypothetical protein